MPTFNWNEPSYEYDLPLLDKHGVVLKEGDKIKIDLLDELILTVSFNDHYNCWMAVKPDGSDPQIIEGLSHRIELILDSE